MHKLRFITLIVIITGSGLFAEDNNQSQSLTNGKWFLKDINIPENIRPKSVKKKIVIAIVDDGVRTSHKDIKGFIWKNPKEVPNNNIDDDGNGCVDDIGGWDVSDRDNDVTPPRKRLKVFNHGTHLAGIVTQISKAAYGDGAADFIEIMPVKCLADRADKTYLKDGYKGIEYAIKAGADIIICSWGVGHISPDESEVLAKAHKKGILIVASAGTFAGREQYPGAGEGVLAVAALDRQSKKIKKSNYGAFIDMAAPGTNILSAGALSDTDYETREGSSMATAIVAAAAAIVKLQHPDYSGEMITACLKNSAQGIDVINPEYNAKLGAGKLNIKAAVESRLFSGSTKKENQLTNPQGYLHYYNPKKKSAVWMIKPSGPFNGLRFKPVSIKGKAGKSILKFYADDSTDSKLLASHPLSDLGESIYVAGTTAYVTFEPKGIGREFEWLLEYKAEPINFSELYCRGTEYLEEGGTIEDGSGPNNYSQNSDCKWLITAGEGKVVHFKFTEFDTEAKTDLLYFFNGSGTHEKIMAVFSGPNIPPELTTWGNRVLVWFVTDGKNQGKGWKAQYHFQDP